MAKSTHGLLAAIRGLWIPHPLRPRIDVEAAIPLSTQTQSLSDDNSGADSGKSALELLRSESGHSTYGPVQVAGQCRHLGVKADAV